MFWGSEGLGEEQRTLWRKAAHAITVGYSLAQGFPAAPPGYMRVGLDSSAQRPQSSSQSNMVTVTPFKEDPQAVDQWGYGSLILGVVAITLRRVPSPWYSATGLAALLPGPLEVLLAKEG